jgi:dTDP-glucose 4,6-dehydratase
MDLRLESGVTLLRVLVTGGAGFIGSNFVRAWAQQKFPLIKSLVVLDKLTYAGNFRNMEILKNHKNFNFIKGDICDTKKTTRLINEVDSVINFAAESHVDKSLMNPKIFIHSNIEGIAVMLEAIQQKGTGRFLQISTDEVYGSINSGEFDESSRINPSSPYSASKAAAELLVNAFQNTYGIDAVITRSSNNYGPYQHPEKLIPRLITNLIQGKNLPIYGDGQNMREWQHVEDNCNGIYLALIKGTSGSVYNLGSKNLLSNLEIAKFIINEFEPTESKIQFISDRKGHDFRYSINSNKAKIGLGYAPSVEFYSGLKSTIQWYKQNPKWWKNLSK